MTFAHDLAADRYARRISDISDAIAEAEMSLQYHLDAALDRLVALGCFQSGWGSSNARNLLCKDIAHIAMQHVLTSQQAMLPSEIEWLHVDRVASAEQLP